MTERREPRDFDEPICDAPGYLDPLHRNEVSARCALIQNHPGNHMGYIPAEWPAVCPKCGTAGCLEDANSGWYDTGQDGMP